MKQKNASYSSVFWISGSRHNFDFLKGGKMESSANGRLIQIAATIFIFLLSLCVFVGCEDDDERPDFRVSQTELDLASGESDTIKVGGGRYPYEISSPDESIATATLSGRTITVTGVDAGETTFTIRDGDSYSETIVVNVVGEPATPNRNLLSVEGDRIDNIDFSLIRPATAPEEITAELPTGEKVTLKKEKTVQRDAENYSWFGINENGVLDSVVLTVTDGVMFGRIENQMDAYYIKPHGNTHKFIQHEPEDLIPLINDTAVPNERSAGIKTAEDTVTQEPPVEETVFQIELREDGSVIDVLVLYTERMEEKYGSEINAIIHNFIDLSNGSYDNSGIQTELRLAHAEVYDDPASREDQGIDSALNHIRGSDRIFDLRNNVKADLVCLLREYQGNGLPCGRAWVMSNNVSAQFESYAFSIVEVRFEDERSSGDRWYCSELTFAHEIGHNLGCAHDRGNAEKPGAYDYSYGFDHDGEFGTIMSYNKINRISYFSNPLFKYGDIPIGIDENEADSSNNALTINNTREIVANFRVNIEESDSIVLFPDANLEAIIRAKIEKPTDPIQEEDLRAVETLLVPGEGIESIEGLQYCPNLRELDLRSNMVSDISQLSDLNQLEILLLNENPVDDISDLSGMPSLIELNLSKTDVENLSPLSDLTTLEVLFLWGMGISDISAVSSLSNLNFISFGNNLISDISPLKDLVALDTVWLDANEITDIEPLVQNAGIGEGDEVRLQNNPLNTDSCQEFLPLLEDRGVDVLYSDCN